MYVYDCCAKIIKLVNTCQSADGDSFWVMFNRENICIIFNN